MSYHVLPSNDIFQHTMESTCACEPRYEEQNGEMVFVHNSWDKREWLERALAEVKGKESPDTNKSVEYFSKYCAKLNGMACDGYMSFEDVRSRIAEGFAHMYEAWRKAEVEIVFKP